jgi:hypothetical protein
MSYEEILYFLIKKIYDDVLVHVEDSVNLGTLMRYKSIISSLNVTTQPLDRPRQKGLIFQPVSQRD